jgi:hypothetical protein
MKKITFAVLFFFVCSLANSQTPFSTFSFNSSSPSNGQAGGLASQGCWANGYLTNNVCIPSGMPAGFSSSYPMFIGVNGTYGGTSIIDVTHSTGTDKFLTYHDVISSNSNMTQIWVDYGTYSAYFGGFNIINKSTDGLAKTFTVEALSAQNGPILGTYAISVPYNIVTNINTENVAGFNSVKFIKIKAPSAMNYFGVNQFRFRTQSTLPVELTAFNSNCTENATTINWQTASEHNSAYFDIEKSRDGATWNVIKTVNAAGNSTSTIDYSTIDSEKAIDVVYYRLNQVDIDGASKIYGPISVSCDETNDFTATIFPNPTAKDFSVSFLNSEAQNFDIQLIGTDGKVVYQTTRLVEAGSTIFPLSSEYLNAGVYSLHVKGENTLKTIKLVVQ